MAKIVRITLNFVRPFVRITLALCYCLFIRFRALALVAILRCDVMFVHYHFQGGPDVAYTICRYFV